MIPIKRVIVILNDHDPYDGPTTWTFEGIELIETEKNILKLKYPGGLKMEMIPWDKILKVRVE